MKTDLAFDLMMLACRNVFKEAEEVNQDGYYIVYMMEENCDKYDDVRAIFTEKSKYSEYRQEAIIKDFMKTYKITKEDILNYRKEDNVL